jgi:hypothetical protein
VGVKLVIIRVCATTILVIASYAVGWYIFSRISQLNKPKNPIAEEDINNPRLNKMLLNQIKEDINTRRLYTPNDSIDIQIEENDPFYE